MYTISKVSSITGVTAHTLRYYEKEGVLPPIERDGSGRRDYSEENLIWLDIVTCLKKTDMPVSDIKEIVRLSIIGDETIPKRKEILLTHRKKMVEELEKVKETIEKIDQKLEFYEGKEECF